jgi:CheY-like chemotaxis protein/HAMP domain-containing protein
MNDRQGLTIRQELLGAFVVVLVVAVAPLALALWGLDRLDVTMGDLLDSHTRSLQTSARLHRNVYEVRTQEKALLLAENDDERQTAQERVALLLAEGSKRLRDLRSDAGPESEAAREAFAEAYASYRGVLERIRTLAAGGRSDEARLVSRTEGRTAGNLAADAALAYSSQEESIIARERAEAQAEAQHILFLDLALAAAALLVSALLAWGLGRGLARRLDGLVTVASRIAAGDLDVQVPDAGRDEIGALSRAIEAMLRSLRQARTAATNQDWLKSGVARLGTAVLGQRDADALATTVLTEVVAALDAKVGAVYVAEEDPAGGLLRLKATWAHAVRKNLASTFRAGEGLVGQALVERRPIVLQNAPEDYVRVVSGTGDALPRNLVVAPFVFEDRVAGVVEVGTMVPLGPREVAYLEQALPSVATAFEMVKTDAVLQGQRAALQVTNDELRQQAEILRRSEDELRTQQAELQQTNAELEAQMKRVKESEERLRVQQEELSVTNDELVNKNRLLEQQRTETESARAALSRQAEDLAQASRYKSEFLANMSHELRTPLNSLLLLSRSLRDNPEGNLTANQVESAGVIFSSGSDLLNLINEILDLSKVEAGRMEVHPETLEVDAFCRTLAAQFQPMADSQGLALRVDRADGAPEQIVTDPQRLAQVLKNLVGNAFKFTEQGGVTVTFAPVPEGQAVVVGGRDTAQALAVHVADTGIGIPLDKQKIIFEAFQQADSGDRRRYGGTGLGLSISRELARLLGGEIRLVSEPGKGSTFSLYVPVVLGRGTPATTTPAPTAEVASTLPAQPATRRATRPSPPVEDDREGLTDHDRAVLVVEDDARFATLLAGHIRKRGLKCLVALDGREGLQLARTYHVDGVILDLGLPDMDGWAVLNALKQDVDTRHLPVHIVSAADPSAEGLRIGAIGHACKPLRPEDIEVVLERIEAASANAEKRVLVVEDEPAMRRETVRIIGNGNVKVHEVATGGEALEALRRQRYQLMVLDLGLPDIPGLELLKRMADEMPELPPVVIHTVRELTADEEAALRLHANSIILKDVRSQERLIDEVALFLHRVVSDLPEDKRQAIRRLHDTDEPLRGRTVLIAEDDMRTMFAMARLLASHGMHPLKAENGQRALELLEQRPDVDLVLMDMMMPLLDGYEASRRIRAQQRFSGLPIIALTAKAMKEDRQRCLDAGASDYLTKPVDPEHLVSLMRVWLGR